MAMNSNIRLDTQEQLMEDAKAKAKARYDRKLLDDQEEQIRNLLLMTGMQDPRNAVEEPRKAKKEYTHFEDELPAAEDLMALMNDPEAVKALAEQYRNTTNPPMDTSDMSEEASRAMKDYVPGEAGYGRKLYAEQIHRGYKDNGNDESNHDKSKIPSRLPINPSGVVAYQSDNPFVPDPEFHGGENPRKDQTISKYKTDVLSKPAATIVNDKKLDSIKDNFVPPMAKDEPQAVPQDESNYWMKTLGNPQVDEALKAIADKDPELLQLPEVQKLVKEREFWRNKGMDLFSFAPLATDPNAATQAAMGLIDKGDKNLMDAADNLEKLRQRQLDATKDVADNLTQQKQVAASMHNSVMGLLGNLVQVAIPAQQQAYELRLQAEQVHEAGDEAVQSAITNMQNFVQRLGDMGASANDVAVLNQAATDLNPSNIREFIETVRGVKVNKAMRRELNERLNAISADAAKYATAMITEKKLKEQADFHDARANGLMTAASNLGGEYKIPEWMSAPAPVQAVPTGNDLSTPFSDEKSDVPAKEAQAAAQTPKASTTPVPPKGTKTNTEPAVIPTATPIATFDPWSLESFAKLNANQLKDNIEAMATAYAKKGSSAAKVGIWQSEKGAEGNDVSHRVDLPLKMTEENMGALIRNLSGIRKTQKYKAVMKSLSPNALGIIEKAAESIDPTVSTDAYDAKVSKQRQTSSAQSTLDDQYALIQKLMVESGMV